MIISYLCTRHVTALMGIIKQTGDYKNLLTYQNADVIYRITFYFSHSFMSPGERTIDRMIQTARSGKQNINESYAASATSDKTEIKLLNAAKSSLKGVPEDYKDYIKTRNLRIWKPGSKELDAMRRSGATEKTLKSINNKES